MKVYCFDCEYLEYCETFYRCLAPGNIKDDWLRPSNKIDKYPQEINKNNDCKWHLKKNGGSK